MPKPAIISADRTSINFKRWLPLGAAEATHCDEFESGVDSEAVRKLLDALGFTQMITVDKIRRQWRLGDVIVAMDIVAGLGSFMEVEYACTHRAWTKQHVPWKHP